MTKVFISQPMNGMTDDEIMRERERAIVAARKALGEVEVLDSFFEDVPEDATPLWYLGQSILVLAQADVAYFVRGWETARGCLIEHACAAKYGISTIEEWE